MQLSPNGQRVLDENSPVEILFNSYHRIVRELKFLESEIAETQRKLDEDTERLHAMEVARDKLRIQLMDMRIAPHRIEQIDNPPPPPGWFGGATSGVYFPRGPVYGAVTATVAGHDQGHIQSVPQMRFDPEHTPNGS